MKDLQDIKLETKNVTNITLLSDLKEFQELTNLLEDHEVILDIVVCNINKPVIKKGILLITSDRLLFVFDTNNTRCLKLNEIIKIDYKKGMMFSKIFVSNNSNSFEFDFIQNNYVINFTEKIKSAKNNYTTKSINQTETTTTELTTLEKIQFRKFISENSGIELKDVDQYILNLTDLEVDELKLEFKKAKQLISIEVEKPIIQEKTSVDNLPTCPKCGSKQVTFNKKGFSFGKAALGGILTGGIGLLAGGIGKDKIILTCLKCSNKWTK